MENRDSKISIALAVLVWLLICGAAIGGYFYGRSVEDEQAAYRQGQRNGAAAARRQYFRGVRDGARSVFSRYGLKKGGWYTIHLTSAFGSARTRRYIDSVYPVQPRQQYSLCRVRQRRGRSASINAPSAYRQICSRTAPR
jgi:hypothetical protein